MSKIAVIGAGLTGCVIARGLAEKGNNITIYEQSLYIGGLCSDYKKDPNYYVNRCGGHIFHTDNESVWKFVNKFTKMIPYNHVVKISHNEKYYTIPFNLRTLKEVYGEQNTLIKFNADRPAYNYTNDNIGYCKGNFGCEITNSFIIPYSEKHWQMKFNEIPFAAIQRLPKINLESESESFFNNKYVAMPEHGYTNMLKNMIDHPNIKLELLSKISGNSPELDDFDRIIWTGRIDEYYKFERGKLEYKSVAHDLLPVTMNYASINLTNETKYTRLINFAKMYGTNCHGIYAEYPSEIGEPAYPVNNNKNTEIYENYNHIFTNVIFAGRLGLYKYLDMDVAIGVALNLVNCFNEVNYD